MLDRAEPEDARQEVERGAAGQDGRPLRSFADVPLPPRDPTVRRCPFHTGDSRSRGAGCATGSSDDVLAVSWTSSSGQGGEVQFPAPTRSWTCQELEIGEKVLHLADWIDFSVTTTLGERAHRMVTRCGAWRGYEYVPDE